MQLVGGAPGPAGCECFQGSGQPAHLVALLLVSQPDLAAGLTRRCIKLALVHDVAEAIVGDITPTCGVSDQDKYQLEAGAVQRIKGMLGGASLAGGGKLWGELSEAGRGFGVVELQQLRVLFCACHCCQAGWQATAGLNCAAGLCDAFQLA